MRRSDRTERLCDERHSRSGHLQSRQRRRSADVAERRVPLRRQFDVRLRRRDGEKVLDHGSHGTQRLVVDAAQGKRVVLLSLGELGARALRPVPVDRQQQIPVVPQGPRRLDARRFGRRPVPVGDGVQRQVLQVRRTSLFSLADRSNNAQLKPERTTAQEGGLEMSVLNDRLTIDGTYYLKKTRDQIFR